MIIDKNRQKVLRLIRHLHEIVKDDDIEKDRQNKELIGNLMKLNTRDYNIKEFTVEGVDCEVIIPAKPYRKDKMIFYCHGGGFLTGSKTYSRTVTTKLAMAFNLPVISFDYGLAPEKPFPAALLDTVKVWDYMMLKGYGADSFILAGDSAGGNLALELCINLKKNKRKLPVAMLLFSPWTDMTCNSESFKNNQELDPVLTEEYIKSAISAYTKDEIDGDNELISPLFADFEGFPPTLIQVGENEILLDDSKSLAEKMRSAGNVVDFEIFENMWHVFQMTPLKKADIAIDKCADFVFNIIS